MTTGYAGKLPSHGDFVEGGGSRGARQAWSAWAEDGLAAARAEGGEDFQQRYLTAPIWRFAVTSGVFGSAPAAGVFCPSIDRVGRLFAFATLAELPDGVEPLTAAAVLDDWFVSLESSVLAALDPSASLDTFQSALGDPPVLRGSGGADAGSHDAQIERLRVDGDGRPAAESDDLLDLGGEDLDAADGVWIALGGSGAAPRGYTHRGRADETLFRVLVVGEDQDAD